MTTAPEAPDAPGATDGTDGEAPPDPDAVLLASTSPWALQLVLRDERSERATHLAACEAAATAVVRLLTDDRAAPGGPWFRRCERWSSGRIRKLVRRARGAHFEATSALDHVEVVHRGAQVRAFVPLPLDHVPPVLTRLQVSGTDLPDAGEPAPRVPGGLVVALTPHAALTTGKAAAQSGHAAQLAWLSASAAERLGWQRLGFPVRAVRPDAAGWARALDRATARVADAGFTEVEPGTVTAVAWFAGEGPPGT